MKTILVKTLVLSILLPCVVNGSYFQEADEIYGEHAAMRGAAKCILIVELVKKEKDSKRKEYYKRALEIEALMAMDEIESDIMSTKSKLQYEIQERDRSTTDEKRAYWDRRIEETHERLKIEENRLLKVQNDFLKYTY